MKVSKEQSDANRAALVKAASKLFREKGIDGVGVAEISKEAGLTHGALYAHFPSKSALAAEALALGLGLANKKLYGKSADEAPDLDAFLDYYLSTRQRDNIGGHCAMAASASEIGRQDEDVSASFTEGYLEMVRAFENHVAQARPELDSSNRGLAIVAALVGGIAMARATQKSNPALSKKVLQGMRELVDEAGGLGKK